MNKAASAARKGEGTMGLLVGLPMMLFRLLFVVLRLAVPILLILLVIWLRGGEAAAAPAAGRSRPRSPNSTVRCIPWTTRT